MVTANVLLTVDGGYVNSVAEPLTEETQQGDAGDHQPDACHGLVVVDAESVQVAGAELHLHQVVGRLPIPNERVAIGFGRGDARRRTQ